MTYGMTRYTFSPAHRRGGKLVQHTVSHCKLHRYVSACAEQPCQCVDEPLLDHKHTAFSFMAMSEMKHSVVMVKSTLASPPLVPLDYSLLLSICWCLLYSFLKFSFIIPLRMLIILITECLLFSQYSIATTVICLTFTIRNIIQEQLHAALVLNLCKMGNTAIIINTSKTHTNYSNID